jgi:hypothetical protein
LLVCALLAGAPPHAGAEPQSLECRSRPAGAEPHAFRVEFDLVRRRLLAAPARDVAQFEVREAPDAVFFMREARLDGAGALEWISINRFSGAYAHFIAPLDPESGGLRAPTLLAAADCAR